MKKEYNLYPVGTVVYIATVKDEIVEVRKSTICETIIEKDSVRYVIDGDYPRLYLRENEIRLSEYDALRFLNGDLSREYLQYYNKHHKIIENIYEQIRKTPEYNQ
jgi:hypothetical protein